MPSRWRSRLRFDGTAVGEWSLAGQEGTVASAIGGPFVRRLRPDISHSRLAGNPTG